MSDSQFNRLFDEFLGKVQDAGHETREACFRLVQGQLSEVLKLVQEHEQKEQADAAERQQAASAMKQPAPQSSAAPAQSEPPVANLSPIELAIADHIMQQSNPREAFIAFDQIGNGTLTKTEFHAAVNSMGIFLYDDEVETLVAKYDTDGDGSLDYSEFVRCAGRVPSHMYSASDYDNALAGRPAPVPHTQFVLEDSKEDHLANLCESIRAKLEGFSGARDAFLALNRLGDAQLTVQELRRGLASRGLRVSTEDLRALTRPYMKTDPHKRYLTVGEFSSFLQGDRWHGEAVPVAARGKQLPASTPLPKALQMIVDAVRLAGKSALETFNTFDSDGDGSVTPAELRRALQHWGHFVDMALCVALVKRFDVTHSGTLNYRELVKLLGSAAPTAVQTQPAPAAAAQGDARATSNLVRSKAAASARRRRLVQSSAVTEAQQGGVASFPPLPPHVAAEQGAGAVPRRPAVAPPSKQVLSDVSWAVYHSRSGPTKLYRDMKRHGQLGVDEDDLVYGLHRVGVKLSQADAVALMAAFDQDQDGVLSLTEWLKLLQDAQAASA